MTVPAFSARPNPALADLARRASFRAILVIAAMLALPACGGGETSPAGDAGGDGSAPNDAGNDSGTDSGSNGGTDSGSNGGTDAGTDSGSSDAGFDMGSDMCPAGSSTATATQYCTEFCSNTVVTCSVPLPDGGDCMSLCTSAYGDPNTTAFQRGRMLDCLTAITSAADCSNAFVCADMAKYCP